MVDYKNTHIVRELKFHYNLNIEASNITISLANYVDVLLSNAKKVFIDGDTFLYRSVDSYNKRHEIIVAYCDKVIMIDQSEITKLVKLYKLSQDDILSVFLYKMEIIFDLDLKNFDFEML